MNLNSEQDFKKIDSMGVFDALTLFPEQVLDCYRQAFESDIPKVFAKSVVVSGMGGSSNAAKILQGIFEDDLGFPFIVHNDYGLPVWVNSETLVVVNSYSGNTEETLSAIDAANKVEARVMGITTGGKIGELINSKSIIGTVVNPGKTNPTGFPKTGLGVSLGALFGALDKSGTLPVNESILRQALDELKKTRESWNAKELATWIHGGLPILFSARPLVGALNAGRNAMCEISRNFCQFYDFPEVDHVLVEAMSKPEIAKNSLRYLFFESDLINSRISERFKITSEIMTEQGLNFKSCKLKGTTKLSQALELAYISAWVGFYLSMLDGTDPGPEPWILKLKNSLAVAYH